MTTANTTAAKPTSVDQDQLFAQLELVDRYGEDFTYAELSAIAWDLDTVLRELILQSADERLTVYIQTAKAELQQVIQPAGLTGKPSIRLVVVILLLGRSAMLQARQGFLVTG